VTYCVTILPRANQQLLEQASWWATNRSTEQALRWLDGFELSLAGLATNPERCVVARQSDAFQVTIRELHYGLRKKGDSSRGFRDTE
jgi:plasmid stabilization system protein ParE